MNVCIHKISFTLDGNETPSFRANCQFGNQRLGNNVPRSGSENLSWGGLRERPGGIDKVQSAFFFSCNRLCPPGTILQSWTTGVRVVPLTARQLSNNYLINDGSYWKVAAFANSTCKVFLLSIFCPQLRANCKPNPSHTPYLFTTLMNKFISFHKHSLMLS